MSLASQGDAALKHIYREVTEAEAPELFKSVRKLSEKAGVEMPSIHFLQKGILDGHPMKTMHDYLIGIMPNSKGNALVVGDKVLEVFGHQDLKAPLTEEFESIIAHEMGHLKYNDAGPRGLKAIASHSPLLGVAAAIGATALVSHYLKKQKAQSEGAPTASAAAPASSATPEKDTIVSATLPGEKGYSHEQEAEDRKHPLGWAMTAAKYMAASAVGLVSGTYVSKMLHHRMEYRADKFSAEMMGSGKPLASALEKFRKAGIKESEGMMDGLRKNGMSEAQIAKMQKIGKYIEEFLHPPILERIERLARI
jgi:Zn-dependent protease with chaperone function